MHGENGIHIVETFIYVNMVYPESRKGCGLCLNIRDKIRCSICGKRKFCITITTSNTDRKFSICAKCRGDTIRTDEQNQARAAERGE